MKNLEEKKLLVKMSRMLGEPVDPALLESIEREEKLAAAFFGAPKVAPKLPPIPIFKEDLPQPLKIEQQPVVVEVAIPSKEEQVKEIENTITVPAPTKSTPYRDKEIEGIRKQIAEMMQKISTMSWGGGGTGIVRIGDADDFDRASYGENKYMSFSNGWFRLVDAVGGGSQGPQGPPGTLPNWILRTANYTAANNNRIIADTSNGSFTVTLPASPNTGDYIIITDGYDWRANNLSISRNGSTIEGISDDMYIDVKGITVEFIYNGNPTVNTWQVTATTGPQGVQGPQGAQGVVGPQGPAGIAEVPTVLVNTSAYTLTANDHYVGVNYAGSTTITVPVTANTGRMIIVKDESGNCSNNPIIISGNIDNDANGVNLQINNGAIQMLYRGGWRIV